MPVFKNSYQTKMAKVNGSPNGELILHNMNESPNPFDETLEEDEQDSSGNVSPGGGNPFDEDEIEPKTDLVNGSLPGSAKRRGTLEKIVGLSPFKMGKNKKGGSKEKQINRDRRSFLGKIMDSLNEQDHSLNTTPEKKKMRRSSEDFNILQMLNGRRRESFSSLELSPTEGANGGSDTLKRLNFLKLGRGTKPRRVSMVDKLLQPGSYERIELLEEVEDIEKPKEPLSVLEIHQLIQKRDLRAADMHIIDLEAECDLESQRSPESPEVSKDSGRKTKDVTLLYQALMEQLWAVVDESLTVKSIYQPLEDVIRVIDHEEATDKKALEARGVSGVTGPRPREMKRKWAEAVKMSMTKRLCQCTEGKGVSISAQMDKLKKCAVEDLYAVKNHLICVYPKEYEVFKVYLKSCHEGIASWLTDAVQRSLQDINDLYVVLDWNSNIYNREVLGRPEIASLASAIPLDPLLPLETQVDLEDRCVSAVQAKLTNSVTKELEVEEEKWRQESKLEEFYCGLSHKVISALKVHVDRAPTITPEFGARIAGCCLETLNDFLRSFQKKVERFHESWVESGLSQETYVSRTIAIGNCCPPFREYVERLVQFDPVENEDMGKRATGAVDIVTNRCNRVLADLLFEDLKPYFHKLMKKKWLSNSDAFNNILSILTDYSQRFRKMSAQPYQMLVNEVHRRVLIEYIQPLMQVKMVCNSTKTRNKMAAKLQEEALQLKHLFRQLESTYSWLDVAVPHLAEIIVLEDTPSIQMEVGMLVTEFPDIRKRHVSAILDVRGTWNQAVRQEILTIVRDLENSDSMVKLPRSQAFFSEIVVTKEARCVHVSLNRASRLSITFLSRLRPGHQLPVDTRQRRKLRDQAESQV
ncbi:exocyst complex component 3-like protein 2 [Ambystoma mexicanum]|uniref:exocyst complex component 3-like protein 2 n=1 Tax=Ambystoma mexicanum TaxID=8296 RepID=UPI0037E750A1